MNGLIVLDKPQDFTSFDAVAVMRKILHEKKIGHTGTLDPMATGVLPILIGRGTKCADLMPDTDKSYVADFKLGVKTDTLDSTGKTLEEGYNKISREKLEENFENFRGEISQIPPMYSAVSVGGKRLYELARQGIEVERESRKIFISELVLTDYDEETGEGKLRVSCSKGTYIRTLIDDIAVSLGLCGGIMTALRRVKACGFTAEDALTLDELKALADEGKIDTVLRGLDGLFDMYRKVTVSPAQQKRFLNGGELALDRLRLKFREDKERVRVMSADGKLFLGIAEADLEKGELKLVKILYVE
ncbi:MAG: tRNA pseudouridine(55) synthase TruB [Clostridia bacterium]|nr:tRNA pseudouridine(55) synthase TruB [Clostridia bacterium]